MSHIHRELDAPPPLAAGALRVTPLGGLGEVGRNMTVFEFGGKLLIVDCGVLFPEENHPGVDLILPDFGPIRDRLDDVVGIVLTHGHEDHIGAVPYLLREHGDIPIIGPLLFEQNLIVYAMYVLIVVIDLALFRSKWGLRTRAVGEHPKAADTVGINVRRTRYVNVIVGGVVAGLGGASLTLGSALPFGKNMTNGKGFIALAAVIFGRWSPRGAVGAALLFGFADALQNVLSFIGTPVAIPSNFLAMLPYLATILAVAGLVGRVRAPAADGEPYVGR